MNAGTYARPYSLANEQHPCIPAEEFIKLFCFWARNKHVRRKRCCRNTTGDWWGHGMTNVQCVAQAFKLDSCSHSLDPLLTCFHQALWGRALDFYARPGNAQFSYRAVVNEGFASQGISSFFTPSKLFSRILMNAPAEGTLSWFYQTVLPLGEPTFIRASNSAYEMLRQRPTRPLDRPA